MKFEITKEQVVEIIKDDLLEYLSEDFFDWIHENSCDATQQRIFDKIAKKIFDKIENNNEFLEKMTEHVVNTICNDIDMFKIMEKIEGNASKIIAKKILKERGL